MAEKAQEFREAGSEIYKVLEGKAAAAE
jgi:hypothetical protein